MVQTVNLHCCPPAYSIYREMNWRRRIPQWMLLVEAESSKGSRLGLALKMLRAILSGPVPRRVWRRRMRKGCFKCPIYNPVTKACRPIHPEFKHLGCGCYTPFSALWARPYRNGCWGRDHMENIGWPAYFHANRWAQFVAIMRFLVGK